MGRRSWWGWGREGAGLSDERRRRLGMLLGTQIDTSGLVAMAPPALGDDRFQRGL